jgi:GT2 family glycosyltransferase
LVSQAYPQTRIIRLDENQGPCRARNLACQEARGRFWSFVDNDCELHAGWLRHALEAVEAASDIGGVASAVLREGDEGLVESLGLGIADNGMCRQIGYGQPMPALEGPQEIICLHTCACLVRAEAMAQVGLFDETFFIYFEEPDLCLRLWWAGWRVVLEPRAVATHHHDNTLGLRSLQKLYYLERNHYWVVLKDMPARQLWLLPLCTLWRYLLAARLVVSNGGESNDCRDFFAALPFWKLARTLLAANLHALRHAPEMLGKRRAVRKIASTRDMQALLKRNRITLKEALVNHRTKLPWDSVQ